MPFPVLWLLVDGVHKDKYCFVIKGNGAAASAGRVSVIVVSSHLPPQLGGCEGSCQ